MTIPGMPTRRSFDDLVAEAVAVPVEGWDFSWLDGRATEQRPSWGYQRLMSQRLRVSKSVMFRTLAQVQKSLPQCHAP